MPVADGLTPGAIRDGVTAHRPVPVGLYLEISRHQQEQKRVGRALDLPEEVEWHCRRADAEAELDAAEARREAAECEATLAEIAARYADVDDLLGATEETPAAKLGTLKAAIETVVVARCEAAEARARRECILAEEEALRQRLATQRQVRDRRPQTRGAARPPVHRARSHCGGRRRPGARRVVSRSAGGGDPPDDPEPAEGRHPGLDSAARASRRQGVAR